MKIMKNFQFHYIQFLFLSILLLQYCSENENPISNKIDKDLDLEIISCENISITWDSTVYQGVSRWGPTIDSTTADSLANVLKDSEILIQDMYTPNAVFTCGEPIRGGSIIIVKLSDPDSSIFKYGFENNYVHFTFCCIFSWRHYKYTYN